MENNVHVSLDALDMREFANILPNRRAEIEKAPAKPLPGQYAANKLAQTLHPRCQYLRVSKVIPHGKDIKSFELIPDPAKGTGACAYFNAGQYLSVSLKIGGSRLAKPYSICSSPAQALEGKYVLTIKRAISGFASNYILDNWDVGTLVETSGPEGNFCYEPLRDAKTVVGIAGGSGITPFHSLAGAIADGTEDCSLTLLYGSRRHDDILLKAEFDALMVRCSKIKVIHVLSDEKTAGYESGFITADLITKYAPVGDYSLFLCGPQQMYDFMDKEIEKLRLPLKRVRHELFGEFRNPEKEADYPQNMAGRQFSLTVSVRGDKKVIPSASGETLLVAMERAGIAAPSRCRSGECGFCHSRLVRGNVYIPSTVDGRRLADVKFGYIHPCCTFPISDLELDVPLL
jgi:ferredoxin-NADP reductase